MAYYLVADRLRMEIEHVARFGDDATICDNGMRLLVLASVGTAKARLIASVKQLFASANRQDWLTVCAPTGAAATTIGGRTFHSLLVSSKKEDSFLLSSRFVLVDET